MNWRNILYALLVVCSCCLLLLAPPSRAISLVLCVMSLALLMEPAALLPLLCVTSISSSIVVIPGLAGYYYYSYLFILGCFISYKCRPSFNFRTLLVLAYVVWLIISAQLSISNNMTPAIRMAFAIFPIFMIPSFSFKEENVRKFMLLGALAISVSILFKLLVDPVLYTPGAYDPYYNGNNTIQLTIAEQINPNTAAQCLLLCFIVIYIYAINNSKWWSLALSIIPIISIITIGSRTVYIAMVCIMALSFVLWAKIKPFSKLGIILGCAILGGLIVDWVSSMNERLVLASITEDQGSGRFLTWETMFDNVIPYNLVSGIGFGRTNLEYIGYYVDADNMYVDALCQIGVGGFTILLLMLLALGKSLLKKQMTASRIALAMLLFVFVVGFGETVFDTFIFVYIILYSIVAGQFSIQSKNHLRYDKL